MSDKTEPLVALESVTFRWPGRRAGERFTLAVERFEIQPGERLALVGPSGAGKSTLLSLLAGVVAPESGSVTVAGADFAKLGSAARDRHRAARIGVIFQMFNLLPFGGALDNVLLALGFSPERRRRAEAAGGAEAEARRLLSALGLPAELATAPAAELSVGQQQRVAAARALIGGPSLVLADEPTSSLDAANRDGFLDLLFAEAERVGAGVLTATHDPAVAARFDRVATVTDIARTTRTGSTPMAGAA